MNLRDAARAYTRPAVDGRISVVYGDHYFKKQQEGLYGKRAWQDACTKARTEYNFGSNAVRW